MGIEPVTIRLRSASELRRRLQVSAFGVYAVHAVKGELRWKGCRELNPGRPRGRRSPSQLSYSDICNGPFPIGHRVLTYYMYPTIDIALPISTFILHV